MKKRYEYCVGIEKEDCIIPLQQHFVYKKDAKKYKYFVTNICTEFPKRYKKLILKREVGKWYVDK